MRRFAGVSRDLHEKLPVSIVKISHSTSTVFTRSGFDGMQRQMVLSEFEASQECDERETLKDILHDESHESLVVYLVLSVLTGQENSQGGPFWRVFAQRVQSVSVPDSVEEIFDKFFSGCTILSRVTFGECSSLKRIGIEAFCGGCLSEIHIPDSVEELCDKCFCECKSLSRVVFGRSSCLKRIGIEAFMWSDLREIHIPDSVEELCEECFFHCKNLSRVIFGEASSLKSIGIRAFSWNGVTEIHIPDSVEELCESCFSECQRLSLVTFG